MKASLKILLAGCALALTLQGLVGCDSSSSTGAAARAARKANRSHRVVAPGQLAPADMVAAVSAGKSGPPVELKFDLRSPPHAGEPVDVDIAVLPDSPMIARVYGKFSAGEGLELVAGGELEAVEKPAVGSVIRHVLQVVPKQDGIYTLTATVAVELENDSITRSFSIPLIVGQGIPETGSNGEPAGAAVPAPSMVSQAR